MEQNKGEAPQKNQEEKFVCEVCKTEYGKEKALLRDGVCCGQKLTPLQKFYESSPSPTGV